MGGGGGEEEEEEEEEEGKQEKKVNLKKIMKIGRKSREEEEMVEWSRPQTASSHPAADDGEDPCQRNGWSKMEKIRKAKVLPLHRSKVVALKEKQGKGLATAQIECGCKVKKISKAKIKKSLHHKFHGVATAQIEEEKIKS
ncbi:hypothetical protein DM860_013502 [Cuscuta australis]|uniref:Uncharacterized protein n=1 Tax=Cuscuta australis TaxID=267555 RepID=A0A328EBR2_9ASTE|nr:hypothetical protein DM860_013502 [Cuscuta australis]